MSPGKEGFLPGLLQAWRKSAAVCSLPPEIAKYIPTVGTQYRYLGRG
jgi:hypothetical protein